MRASMPHGLPPSHPQSRGSGALVIGLIALGGVALLGAVALLLLLVL